MAGVGNHLPPSRFNGERLLQRSRGEHFRLLAEFNGLFSR